MTIFENELRSRFGERFKTNLSLKPYTTLRIGGPARFLIEVEDLSKLIEGYRLALKNRIPIYFLAGCSNVLISDDGLPGLAVINRCRAIEWRGGRTVRIEGGCSLDRFVTELSQRGWADLSFAAGIPGSVGGALAGGAGAYGRLVCEYLQQADVLHPDGSVETTPAQGLGIQYRSSEARRRRDIILAADLGPFELVDADELLESCERIRADRIGKHPGRDLPSAGSFFKNLPPSEPGGRRIPAGKVLEEAGVKSLRFGDAGVFEKHANIIVNYGHATASDVNRLAEEMARRVKEKFGIILEREVQYLC